jgi:ABC-type transport system substrate-binding protein
VFSDQYEPKSPWVDQRVRLAANHAINRRDLNQAETLGYSVLSGSIIPRKFDYALPLEPYAYDPHQVKQLLKEAGYPNGFEAGECSVDTVFTEIVESALTDLGAKGVRAKVRPLERAAFVAGHQEKTLRNLAFQGSGLFGNAATRLEAFAHSRGYFRGVKTLTLMPDTPSRPSSANVNHRRFCCTRSSRNCTMKSALYRSGSLGTHGHRDRG